MAAKAEIELYKKNYPEIGGWRRDQREELARLSTIYLGLSNSLTDMIAEYNARSRMVNRSIFKTGDTELPEHIGLDFLREGLEKGGAE